MKYKYISDGRDGNDCGIAECSSNVIGRHDANSNQHIFG